MARLPIPGQDQGTWGEILNEYLNVSLNTDGSLKSLNQAQVTGLSASLGQKIDEAQHLSATDPHAAASYAIMIGGGRHLYVQPTPPDSAQDGDVWINTSV